MEYQNTFPIQQRKTDASGMSSKQRKENAQAITDDVDHDPNREYVYVENRKQQKRCLQKIAQELDQKEINAKTAIEESEIFETDDDKKSDNHN
ncbi:unnamed protein product [Adineta steineri]|uniref:Uncharacterized protein n=1 Tax=Adineta steineri TaxID=433720 RepID=A0A815P6E2_9BILA|nr:unnamed protein product [Adineta steineri]CAF4093769.1 unnamed protein product [Adineta steineri]